MESYAFLQPDGYEECENINTEARGSGLEFRNQVCVYRLEQAEERPHILRIRGHELGNDHCEKEMRREIKAIRDGLQSAESFINGVRPSRAPATNRNFAKL
jgi:hypothetical protein